MVSIDDTIAFIRKAHSGQVDKAGRAYWHHPVAVMNRLGEDATEEERLVALLHDVVEDTACTVDDLCEMGYPMAVLGAVDLLTKPTGVGYLPYLEWIKVIAASGNRIAIRVKIADNEENADPTRLALLPDDERERLSLRYAASLAILRSAATEAPTG